MLCDEVCRLPATESGKSRNIGSVTGFLRCLRRAQVVETDKSGVALCRSRRFDDFLFVFGIVRFETVRMLEKGVPVAILAES